MAIFVPNSNVELNRSFGQAINKIKKEYIDPEVARRKLTGFAAVGIEIFKNGAHKIYLNNEVHFVIEFKNRKINPNDVGKSIKVDLHDIKDMKWNDKKLDKDSAKILVMRFNENWWVYHADFKKMKELEEKFKIIQKFSIRGGGYLPLNMRREEKNEFVKGYRLGLEYELPQMWKRHVTISQKYTGVMVYDGNYFDLFHHAQELYVLGYYYSSIIICRTAAEQALIRILIKTGHGLEIYKQEREKRKLKSIEQLVTTCRSYSLFKNKYPINKTAAKKLNQISTLASQLIHPKNDLDELEKYKKDAIKCMDNLQYVIKNHLNFIKDTGTISGYRLAESAKRLK